MEAAVLLHAAAAVASFKAENPFAPTFSEAAAAASAAAQYAQTQASLERGEEEWTLQKNLADKDVQIGTQQIAHAQIQQQVAQQERHIAGLQLDHARAVLDFLSNKFTNAELFEWMSGVLEGVYAYFLQQATAIAQLAQAQLAFERQESAPGGSCARTIGRTPRTTAPTTDRTMG